MKKINNNEQYIKIADYAGAIFGIIGALLIALNINLNWLGYIVFFISSLCFSYVGFYSNKRGLLVMSLVYIIINVIGFIQWF